MAGAYETVATADGLIGSAILDALRSLSREQAGEIVRLRAAVADLARMRDGEIAELKLELRRLEAANAGLQARLEGRR